jgi:hypothetical protein
MKISSLELDAVAAAIAEIPAGEPVVIACGMGVDSVAMIYEWHARGLPRPDSILFADTGSEKPQTYAYTEVLNAWLRSVGWPEVTVLRKTSPKTGDTSLHGECLRKSVLPSLAYGGHSCSLKWKVEPQWKYCRDRYGWQQPRKKRGELERPAGTWAHGAMITKLIGYDAGAKDMKRIKNAVGKWPPGHRYVYPLAAWGWDRAKCIEKIVSMGLPGWDPAYLEADLVTFRELVWIERGGIPCKSACFMCPASQKAEISMLQRVHPKLHEIAIRIERQAQDKGLRTVKGLGRRFAWGECGACEEGFPRPAAAAAGAIEELAHV